MNDIVMQPENSLFIDVRKSHSDWCAYEHFAVLAEGQAPTCIMVGACKFIDVLKLTDGKHNSEWAKIFQSGGTVMLRIICTGPDRNLIIREAVRASRKYDPMPKCNLRGFTLGTSVKKIVASDGRTFDNQHAAAVALGVSQSAISRHLSGHMPHIKGVLLTYQGIE